MKEKTRRVIADMTAEIDRLKRMAVSRDKLLDASEAGWRTTEANLATMAARVDELTEEKEFLVRKNLELTARANSACARAEQLTEQNASLEARRAELADQVLRLRTQVFEEGAEPRLERENVELRQAQDAAIERLALLGQELDERTEETLRLRQAQSDAAEKNALVAEQIDERIKEAETLAGLVSTLRDAIFAAAAGLDVPSVEKGNPSLLEVVAALGDAVREGKDRAQEVRELATGLVLLLELLEEYGYGGPQAFSAEEVEGVVGKTVDMEVSAIDGRVILSLTRGEAS